ncbi:Regulator of RpoS [Sutcliffiella rhizosphaerae]|uniref:Regulator of RpoS n=1 Tax=Sutcliffiella rhizosphaerae TaxID=2880967 RepID=A0ABM8YR98_9BACI|nr:Regulator of RpoS [Sutcliffiella rhizosphaerae]
MKLIGNIRSQLELWENRKEGIPFEEVYRFLHSLKGTARTIGLIDLGNVTENLYEQLEKEQQQVWDWAEIHTFFHEIITLSKDKSVEKATILIVDADAALLVSLKDFLEAREFHVLVSTELEKAMDTFYNVKPDCIIIDDTLKDEQGLHLLHHLKASGQQVLSPVLLISANDNRENRLAAYRAGADDFISKPLDLEEVFVRVTRQVERKKQYDELLLVDELTQAYNRKFFQSAYSRMLSNLARTKESFSVGIIDLDNFKSVNDTYGHLVGDIVLKGLAGFMKKHMRAGDVFARYGGEEFAVMLPRTSVEQAEKLMVRLLEGFKKQPFMTDIKPFTCSFSGGVVEIINENTTLDQIMECADKALYDSKKNGKGKISVYSFDQKLNRQKIKVAVVDDDSVVRMMLSEIIRKIEVPPNKELDIQVFEDGQSFLQSEWIQTKDQFVIILDGMMPKMDGLEVLQKLRNDKRDDLYKVMMLTSRKSERDIQKALLLGADDYVTKPFKLLEVEARIQHLLKRVM